MIFWQTARTAKQARPRVSLPTARAHGEVLEIIVDSGEKYAYAFRHQQASTSRRRLPFASGSAVAESLAEAQVRFPGVPIVYCDNRSMAQEWTYRWLGACLDELRTEAAALGLEPPAPE